MKQLDYTYAFEFILIPLRQELDANSALTGIQHALTFDYSGVPSAWYATVEVSYCSYLGYYNCTTRRTIPDTSSGPPRKRKSQQ